MINEHEKTEAVWEMEEREILKLIQIIPTTYLKNEDVKEQRRKTPTCKGCYKVFGK